MLGNQGTFLCCVDTALAILGAIVATLPIGWFGFGRIAGAILAVGGHRRAPHRRTAWRPPPDPTRQLRSPPVFPKATDPRVVISDGPAAPRIPVSRRKRCCPSGQR
jgi:hypothetical protein